MSDELNIREGLSSQRRAARNRSAMSQLAPIGSNLNFLLNCSDSELANFELALLGKCADLRSELEEVQNLLTETTARVGLVAWFRSVDRPTLKQAIENEETALEYAKRMIRGGEEAIVRATAIPGLPHRIAAATYQHRNIAEGKCRACPRPLAHGSVQYCEEHLAKSRVRARQEKGLSDPGSREYLYAGEIPESTHGRQPGTLASLALNRERKTRAVLAELGLPPGSAAVSVGAAKEALLKCMPTLRDEAQTQTQLFDAAMIPSRTTGQKALKLLLKAGQIDRIGKGARKDPYLYFARRP
jgi:hypothetical protein